MNKAPGAIQVTSLLDVRSKDIDYRHSDNQHGDTD